MQVRIEHLAAAALAWAMTACSTSPPTADTPPHQCEDPRPQVCTLEYAPVCALRGVDEWREYSTGCSACADTEVSGYRDGPCDPDNG